MPQKTTEKKKTEYTSKKSEDALKDRRPSMQVEAEHDDTPWETRLLEVYGGTVTLRYPGMEPGMTTTDFQLTPQRLSLQRGLVIEPGSIAGQVTAFGDEKGQGVVYTALGGRVEFEPPNLQQVKAVGELATVNIVSTDESVEKSMPANKQAENGMPEMDAISLPPMDLAALEVQKPAAEGKNPAMESQNLPLLENSNPKGATDIIAYLREPLVIEPLEGFQMELGQAEYIKKKSDGNPKLKFWQTKLTYENQILADAFETESDETGLHISGSRLIELDVKRLGSLVPEGIEDGGLQAGLVLGEAGVRLRIFPRQTESVQEQEPDKKSALQEVDAAQQESPHEPAAQEAPAPQEAVLTIGDATFYLYDVKREGEHIVSAARGTSSYHSYDIRLTDIEVKNQGSELTGKVESLSMLTGDSAIDCDSLFFNQEKGLHTPKASLKGGDREYSLEEVAFGDMEKIQALRAVGMVEGYQTILYGAVFETGGIVSYGAADVQTVLHYGLDRADEKKYSENAQSFFS